MASENNFELGVFNCDISNTQWQNNPSPAEVDALEARWSKLRDVEPSESARAEIDKTLQKLRDMSEDS